MPDGWRRCGGLGGCGGSGGGGAGLDGGGERWWGEGVRERAGVWGWGSRGVCRRCRSRRRRSCVVLEKRKLVMSIGDLPESDETETTVCFDLGDATADSNHFFYAIHVHLPTAGGACYVL